MAKCLLIHVPVRLFDSPRHIPLSVGMLAAMVKDRHEVAICDLNAMRDIYKNPDDLQDYLLECLRLTKWDYIGVSGLSTQYREIKKVLPVARKTNPQATILAGGGWVSSIPQEMLELNSDIDIACINEGDYTFQEILDGKSPSDIKGIYYKENGQYIATEPRPLVENMDSLPYPAYDLMELSIYFKHSKTNESLEMAQCNRRLDIVAERGCPRQCTFCQHLGGSRWDLVIQLGKDKVREMDKEYGFQSPARWNSPKYITEQFLHIHDTYGVDGVLLMDENLCSNKKRVFSVCDMFISEGIGKKMKWFALGDSASVDDDMLLKMREAGCTGLSYGGESASDRVLLKDIGKGVTRQHHQNAIDAMKRTGIRPLMTFMLGNPNEDIDDICETVEFWIRNNIECFPFICVAYPGTKLYVDYKDFLLQQYDPTITALSSHEKKLKALEAWHMEMDDATEMTAHVSQIFNTVELLGLQQLMYHKDLKRILRFAHDTGRKHSPKWNIYCPTCTKVGEILAGNNN
mgnify:CR=1 FL=1